MVISMVTVNLTDKMSLEKALRKFKKEIDKECILSDYMERTRYVKPSAKKHLKKVHARHIQKKIADAERKEASKPEWLKEAEAKKQSKKD